MIPHELLKIVREVAQRSRKMEQEKLDNLQPRLAGLIPNVNMETRFYRISCISMVDFIQVTKQMNGNFDTHATLAHVDHGVSYQIISPVGFKPEYKNQDFYIVEMIWRVTSEKTCEGFENFVTTIRELLQPI